MRQTLTKFGKLFRQTDMFPSAVSFRDNGRETFTTIPGIVCSVFIFFVVSLYAYMRLIILMGYEETNYNKVTEFGAINDFSA